jgi:hypothetical protein
MFEIDRKTVRGGKTVYNAVGILVLDTKFLSTLGDLGTPELAISGAVAGLQKKGSDLLWKGLEVTTGAQREHRYDRLMQQAVKRGYALGPLRSYLEFFRYGCPPHGGVGIGPLPRARPHHWGKAMRGRGPGEGPKLIAFGAVTHRCALAT